MGHADRDAAEREAARERGEERVHPQLRHQQPVDEAHDRPGADRDGEAPRDPQWTAAHAPSTSLSAKIDPSDRSKLPAMIVNVTATAAMPIVAFW